MFNIRIPFILALLFILSGCTRGAHDLECANCNLIVISLDTLRKDHLEFFGYHRPTMPFLSSLVKERGILFRDTYSPSYITMQSHMSIFSGMYPQRHGVLCGHGSFGDGNYCSGRSDSLSTSIKTLPEILKSEGYETFFFAGDPNRGMFSPTAGFERGVDHFVRKSFQSPAEITEILTALPDGKPFYAFLHTWLIHSPYLVPKGKAFFTDQQKYSGAVPATFEDNLTAQRACKKMGASKCILRNFRKNNWPNEIRNALFPKRLSPDKTLGRPFQISMMRYRNPEDQNRMRSMYDNTLRYVDDLFFRLYSGLKRKNLLEKTIILILSDHGDGLFEHADVPGHGAFHKEVIEVPLIIFHPKIVEPRKVDLMASLVDVMPTSLALLGISSPKDLDGEDLLRIESRPYVYGYAYRPEKRAKYILNEKFKVMNVNENQRFFDRKSDPKELNPKGLPENDEQFKMNFLLEKVQ